MEAIVDDHTRKQLEKIEALLSSNNLSLADRSKCIVEKANLLKGRVSDEEILRLSVVALSLNPFVYGGEDLYRLYKDTGKTKLVKPEDDCFSVFVIKENIKSKKKGDAANEQYRNRLTKNQDHQQLINPVSFLYEKNSASEEFCQCYIQWVVATAIYYAKEKKNIESSLLFWIDAFKCLQGNGYYENEVFTSFLQSVINNNSNLPFDFDFSNNTLAWKEVLHTYQLWNPSQWGNIFEVITLNRIFLLDVIDVIQSDAMLQMSILQAFNGSFGIQLDVYDINDTDEFLKKIHLLSTRLLNKYKNYHEAFFESFNKEDYIEDNIELIIQSVKFGESFKGLTTGESKQIKDFIDNCIPDVLSYMREKDSYLHVCKGEICLKSIAKLVNSIKKFPTQYASDFLLNICIYLRNKIENRLSIAKKTIAPNLNVEFLERYTTIIDGTCKIRAIITNGPNLGLADKIHITVEGRDICSTKDIISVPSLVGGQSREFEVTFKCKDYIQDDCFLQIYLKIRYNDSVNRTKETKEFKSFDVYISNPNIVFNEIKNGIYVTGGAVSSKSPTFTGRLSDIEYLKSIVLDPAQEGRQVIIFGQKRTGKSTVVKALKDVISSQESDKAWCVYLTLAVPGKDAPPLSDAYFYNVILTNIKMALCGEPQAQSLIKIFPSANDLEQSKMPYLLFQETISIFKRWMRSTPGWQNRRLVLIIDEFTRLYGSIKAAEANPEAHIKATKEILHHWKGIQDSEFSCFSTILVGHNIYESFFNEPYAINSTSSIQRHELRYFTKEEASSLIEKPTWDNVNDRSRFTKESIDKIFYYTAGHPWYLQQFMSELVPYINTTHILKVSKDVIDIIARKFVLKQTTYTKSIKSFDNLINSGIDSKYCDIKDDEIEIVLRVIAKKSQNEEYCTYISIQAELTNLSERLDIILNDLDTRKIIKRECNNSLIKIIIGIFKEWLIQN